MKYPVVIHKDKKSAYGVTIPDMPGCFSAGDTLDEALEMSREAILLHAEGLLMDGEPVPGPSGIEKYKNKSQYKDGVWALVDVDLSEISGRAKRINVTIPERILSQIDNYTRTTGESRSGFLVSAALDYISSHSK